jgi:cbb3-type cytochrome oxidase cytochrome c subunit
MAKLPETGSFAAGRKAYNVNGCARCHALEPRDEGGSLPTVEREDAPANKGGGRKGPDLTTVGVNHSRDWILQHVRDPKVHQPRSRMPSFDDKISQADMNSLADFLAHQK